MAFSDYTLVCPGAGGISTRNAGSKKRRHAKRRKKDVSSRRRSVAKRRRIGGWDWGTTILGPPKCPKWRFP